MLGVAVDVVFYLSICMILQVRMWEILTYFSIKERTPKDANFYGRDLQTEVVANESFSIAFLNTC